MRDLFVAALKHSGAVIVALCVLTVPLFGALSFARRTRRKR